MNNNRNMIKYLMLMALLLVMLFAMGGCARYRLTEDAFANTMADEYEDGMTKEDYDMRRDELGLYDTVRSIFRKDKSYQQPEIPVYDTPDDEYDDYDEDYDEEVDDEDTEDGEEDPESAFNTSTSTSTTTSSGTTTNPYNRGSSTVINPAKTTDNRIVVTLNCTGGTCTTASISATYGSTYGYLPTPSYQNHEFLGWYSAKSGGKQIKSTTKVTNKKNHSIYAHWLSDKDKKYKITLDLNGGDSCKVKSFKLKTGQTVPDGKLPVAKRKGYAFLGWFTAPSGGKQVKAGSKFTGKADMTLYAQWQKAEDYWADKLTEANGNVREGERVYYYLEYANKSDKPRTTSDSYKLYDFSGVNVAAKVIDGETEPTDEIIQQINELDEDDRPQVVIKCIKDSSKKSEAQEEMMEKFPGCEVIVLSNNAAEGSPKERLFYSIWLSMNLYTNFGEGDIDIDKAASELGVKLK